MDRLRLVAVNRSGISACMRQIRTTRMAARRSPLLRCMGEVARCVRALRLLPHLSPDASSLRFLLLVGDPS